MQYFRLMQDTDYQHVPFIVDAIRKIDWRYTTPEGAYKIAEITVFQIGGKEIPDFIDLLSRQLFLVTGALKEAIKMYVPKLKFKTVMLSHQALKLQETYYLPIFPMCDCLSEKSIQTPDKSKVKQLVINQAVSGPIYRVQHSHETIIVVRLDVAESILRRRLRGIRLEPVELG